MTIRATAATLACLLLCGAGSLRAQDMRENTFRSLFADQKAVRAGETVTILVVEALRATNDASTNASRESNLALNFAGEVNNKSLPNAALGLSTGNSFKGEGGTSTQGSVRARLAARVDSVLPNGNLVVSGNKKIVINGEEQIIHIAGIVRPSDIMADNSVYSYNVADAEIAFEGSGVVSRAQGPGWLTKFFHWIF